MAWHGTHTHTRTHNTDTVRGAEGVGTALFGPCFSLASRFARASSEWRFWLVWLVDLGFSGPDGDTALEKARIRVGYVVGWCVCLTPPSLSILAGLRLVVYTVGVCRLDDGRLGVFVSFMHSFFSLHQILPGGLFRLSAIKLAVLDYRQRLRRNRLTADRDRAGDASCLVSGCWPVDDQFFSGILPSVGAVPDSLVKALWLLP